MKKVKQPIKTRLHTWWNKPITVGMIILAAILIIAIFILV